MADQQLWQPMNHSRQSVVGGYQGEIFYDRIYITASN
jgi:hypothetical protein